VQQIKTASTKRILGMLEELAEKQPDKYATFWRTFGRVLKEGIPEDYANRDRIARLLRFASTHEGTDVQSVSLADYVSRMKDGQDAIYYISADTYEVARNSPHLEIFRKHGVEVLIAYDRIDEWVVSTLTTFEGKALQSVAKGDLDLGKLGGEAAKQASAAQEEDKPFLERIKAALGDRASDVRTSDRLTDSPSCLISDQDGLSTNFERMLKAAGQDVPRSKPVLEVNPGHPLVQRLKSETDDTRFTDWSHILFDQATLAEGGQLEDPAGFVRRLNELMLTLAGEGPSRIWMPGS